MLGFGAPHANLNPKTLVWARLVWIRFGTLYFNSEAETSARMVCMSVSYLGPDWSLWAHGSETAPEAKDFEYDGP